MSRRKPKRGEDEPVLFDLPLDPPERPARPRAQRPTEAGPAERDDPERAAPTLFDDPPPADTPDRPDEPDESGERDRPAGAAAPEPIEPAGPIEPTDPVAERHRSPEEAAGPPRVTLATRYLAGLADLAVHAALAVILLVGARLLGVAAGYDDWPALTLFLLVFSFLYSVLPLAFWGRTPGMAWAGLVARAPGDVSLTFGQTARRWLGGLLTVALFGLPTLLAAAGGRSLADRMSGSELRAT